MASINYFRAMNRHDRLTLVGRDVELVASKTGPANRAGLTGR